MSDFAKPSSACNHSQWRRIATSSSACVSLPAHPCPLRGRISSCPRTRGKVRKGVRTRQVSKRRRQRCSLLLCYQPFIFRPRQDALVRAVRGKGVEHGAVRRQGAWQLIGEQRVADGYLRRFVAQETVTSMYKLHELLESKIEELSADVSSAEQLDAIEMTVSSMIPGRVDKIAESTLATLKRDAPSQLRKEWRHQKQFEKRLGKRWNKPLDILHIFISIAREAGSDFNEEFRNDPQNSNDAVLEALIMLHARACQISSAILVLLRAGYADDAHARWRSLHEIAVVSNLISDNGQDLAERYLLHDIIQSYKSACRYRTYAIRINVEPILQEDFDRLKSERDELIARFGASFEKDYGWAASAIKEGPPTLAAIEEQVALDHWRPYYRMASDNVHANAHGAYFRLGLDQHADEVLLAGPSDMGLTDPGHSTAISLSQITSALLATRSNFDCIVILRILTKLVDEIGEAFSEVHNEHEALAKIDP